MRGPIAGFRGYAMTVALAVAMAGLCVLGLLAVAGRLTFSEGYHVKALLPTSASLAAGARVTMAGVEVGQVKSVERKGLGVVIDLRIDDDEVVPVPSDSRVSVRQRTPVGENYVTIHAGRSPDRLASGDVLPASSANDYVDVDQILSVFRGKTRDRMRSLIQGLGQGVEGRGAQLNTTLAGTAGVFEHGGKVLLVLGRNRRQIARLVENLGDVGRAVGQRGTAVRELSRYALQSLRAVGRRDAALRATLRQAPSTLARVRKTTETLRSVSGEVPPVIEDVAAVVRRLGPAVGLLAPAAQEGRRAVHALAGAAPRLKTTLRLARRLSRPAAGALPKLDDMLCELNPALEYAAPYTKEVAATLASFGSATNAYDALGHTVRVTLVTNEAALVGVPPNVSKAAFELMHAGVLQESHGQGYNAYPDPGRAAKNDGLGVIGPSEVKTKYTRVRSCRQAGR